MTEYTFTIDWTAKNTSVSLLIGVMRHELYSFLCHIMLILLLPDFNILLLNLEHAPHDWISQTYGPIQPTLLYYSTLPILPKSGILCIQKIIGF